MEPLVAEAFPSGALLLVDSAPIIYTLQAHPKLAGPYASLFARHAAVELSLAVTTITIAKVLTGPLGAGEGLWQNAIGRYWRLGLQWSSRPTSPKRRQGFAPNSI